MKKIICAIVAGISVVAAFGQAVRTFNSTNELVAAGHNPMSQNTNSWVINTNDMSYQMWTWFQGDTSVASTYNLESLRPGVVGRYKLVENLHWNRAGDVNGDTYVIYSFLTNFVATNVISGASVWTNDAGIVRLINMTLPVKITNSILMSDGGTNAIKLISVTDAGYTNGAADVKFQTLNGSGYGAALEAQNQSAFVTAVGGANQMGLRALSHQVTLDSVIAGFRPVVDLGEDNGVMKYAWRSNIVQHSIIRGFESGVGSPNFSILDIYQTDTNSPVVLNQQTGGTAGYSRGFSFQTNGVEVFNVTGTGGPSSGANWTAVGTTDSSLAGTAKAYRLVSSNSPANVYAYGASGTGLVDDRTAIQAAVTALGANGGTVYLPDGVFWVSLSGNGGISLPDNVTLMGNGPSSIIIYTNAGAAIYNSGYAGAGNTNISIREITLNLQHLGNNGIDLSGVANGTIANVRVMDAQGYGIYLNRCGDTPTTEGIPCSNYSVVDNHVTGTVDAGIEIRGCVGVSVANNTVAGEAGQAYLAWDGSTDCVFSGNIAQSGTAGTTMMGYRVSGRSVAAHPTETQRITFIGNVSRTNAYAFYIIGDHTLSPASSPSDILISANQIYGSITRGVWVQDCSRTTVQGNRFVLGNVYPVHMPAPPYVISDLVVDGNQFTGGNSLQLYRLNGGSCSYNRFQGTLNHSVDMQGCTNMVLSGNTFTDCGSGTIRGILVEKGGSNESLGNTFIGNRTSDSRVTKWLADPILMIDASDYNLCIGNSAYGAQAGAVGVYNAGTGTHNVIFGSENATWNNYANSPNGFAVGTSVGGSYYWTNLISGVITQQIQVVGGVSLAPVTISY